MAKKAATNPMLELRIQEVKETKRHLLQLCSRNTWREHQQHPLEYGKYLFGISADIRLTANKLLNSLSRLAAVNNKWVLEAKVVEQLYAEAEKNIQSEMESLRQWPAIQGGIA